MNCRTTKNRRVPDLRGRADCRPGPETDALKTHKKGLMQQLFPATAKPDPASASPNSKNAGEWEVTHWKICAQPISTATF